MIKKNITVPFTSDIYEKVKNEAREESRSFSGQVVYIVNQFFKNKTEIQSIHAGKTQIDMSALRGE